MNELETLRAQLASKTLKYSEEKKIKRRIEELEKQPKKVIPTTQTTLL